MSAITRICRWWRQIEEMRRLDGRPPIPDDAEFHLEARYGHTAHALAVTAREMREMTDELDRMMQRGLDAYTDAAAQGARDGLELAAKHCDNVAKATRAVDDPVHVALKCARVIRAMVGKP
jgi:hypothetical protein